VSIFGAADVNALGNLGGYFWSKRPEIGTRELQPSEWAKRAQNKHKLKINKRHSSSLAAGATTCSQLAIWYGNGDGELSANSFTSSKMDFIKAEVFSQFRG